MPKSAERCAEERAAMREKILRQSVLYFARNGFSGTKISDLARDIGIGQGTIYLYFKSKEELFSELQQRAAGGSELAQLKLLGALPLPAKAAKVVRLCAGQAGKRRALCGCGGPAHPNAVGCGGKRTAGKCL